LREDGDLALAEKVAKAGAKMTKEYIAETRKQGRIKGRPYVTLRRKREGPTTLPGRV